MKEFLTWKQIQTAAEDVAETISFNNPGEMPTCILAIARGGLVPATLIAYELEIKSVYIARASSYSNDNAKGSLNIEIPDIEKLRNQHVLIVDDLSDSGDTLFAIVKEVKSVTEEITTATLYIKRGTAYEPDVNHRSFPKETWLVFPWEQLI